VLVLLLITSLLGAGGVLYASDEPAKASEAEELAPKQPKYFLLPFEIDGDSGAANGDAIISRILPANSIAISKKLRLLNMAIVTIADAPGGRPGTPGNPDSAPSPNVFGLGDITDAFLFTKKGAWWGVGGILAMPTATDQALGSGKWSGGLAFRLHYQKRPWVLSLLAGNLRSFAGSDNRGDVNQTLIRALVRRTFNDKWFFIYSPIITANWNASSSDRWLVPIGGGFGRHFVSKLPFNVTVQAYSNAIRPEGAPNTVVRVGLTFPFRFPDK